MLTLSEAIASGRLPEFIAQEEVRGVGFIDAAEFDRVIEAAVKPPQSADQTSRSPSGDGSTGK
jgi:hypothetical protein